MDAFILDPTTVTLVRLQAFLLVLFRVAGMVEVIPVLGAQNVPRQVKVWLSFFISVVIFSVVSVNTPLPAMPQSIGVFLFAAWAEFVLGIMMGWLVAVMLTGFQVGGRMASDQLGFSLANVVDPISNDSVSITSQLIYLSATLLFITLGGLNLMIMILSESFQIVPLLAFRMTDGFGFGILEDLARQIFILGVCFAAPIVVVILLSTVGLGLVGKVVPEMNIFSFSFGIRVFLGLFLLAYSMEFLPGMVDIVMRRTDSALHELLQLARAANA